MLTKFSIIIIISLAIAVPVLLPMFIVLAVFARKRKPSTSSATLSVAAGTDEIPYETEDGSNGNNSVDPPLHEDTKAKSRSFNSSQLLLIIGTAFVVLSGIAFGVASWVKTTPTGRVAIIIAAAAISFLISIFFRQLLKLKGTSASFYSVGSIFSSIALITAGAYQLMGEWLSTKGDGISLLFMLASLLIAALSLIGYKLYEIKASGYVGLYSLALSIIFVASQLTDKFMHFAVLMIIIQVTVTVLFNIFMLHKYIPLSINVKSAADISSIAYGCISTIYVISTALHPTFATFTIIAAILFQMIFYGIIKKNSVLILTQCIMSVFASFIISIWFYNTLDMESIAPVFGICMIIIFLINKFIPVLNNNKNSKIALFAASFTVLTIFMHFGNDMDTIGYAVPLIMSAICLIYTFSKNESKQYVCGIAAPIIFVINAFLYYEGNMAEYFSDNTRTLFFGAVTAIIIAITAIIVFLPNISFEFFAKHHRESDTILYTNLILSAIIIVALSGERYAPFLIPVIIAHFILSHKLRNNFTGIGSVFAILSVIFNYLDGYTDLMTKPVSYIMLGLLALLTIVSRIMYSNSLVCHRDNKVTLDVIQLTSWLAIFYSFTEFQTSASIQLLALALYIGNFVRKNTKPNAAAAILTISTILAAIALLTRPFLLFESDIINNKINLAVIALTGTAFRFIWRKYPSASKLISTVIYILSFASLIIDAMNYHSAGNTIFVLAVTAGILLISSSVKSKTWFTASSAALIIITLYSTKKYLMTLNWWAYLFIVGLILIGAAAFNEFCKSRNISPKEKVKAKFADWKW